MRRPHQPEGGSLGEPPSCVSGPGLLREG